MPSMKLTALGRRCIATLALACLLISTAACSPTAIEDLPQLESVSDQLRQSDRPACVITTSDTPAPPDDTPDLAPDAAIAPLDEPNSQTSDSVETAPIAAEAIIETKSLEVEQVLQAEQAAAAAKLKAANEAAAAALNAELEKATTTFDKELNIVTDEAEATPPQDDT